MNFTIEPARRFFTGLFSHTSDPRIDDLNRKVDQILLNQKRTVELMQQETRDIIKRFDEATNRVAKKLQALVDKANTDGSVQASEVNSALAPIVAHLEALGADEAQPVPVVPAPETAAPNASGGESASS